MLRLERLMKREKLLAANPEIFVNPTQEAWYFQNHQIEWKNLVNGITIVGATRPSDIFRASVNFTFPSGSFFDPENKKGLHHLGEHLINSSSLRRFAFGNQVDILASTSPLELKEICSGITHPQVKDYGLWPILPRVFRTLAFPLRLLKNPEEVIEAEKRRVEAEIGEHYASHDWQAGHHLYQLVFAADNPAVVYPWGTPESLKRIGLEDISGLVEKVFIPQGLVISILNEGEAKVCQELVKYLGNIFEDFPRKEEKRKTVNYSLLEKANPNFKPGKVYKKETGLKNGLVKIMVVYPVEFEPFTTSAFALGVFRARTWERLVDFFRGKGLGYSYDVSLELPGNSTGVLVMSFDLPKAPGLEDFVKETAIPLLKTNVLRLRVGEAEKLVTMVKKNERAVPVSSEARLNWLLKGIRQWGKIVDADKMKGTRLRTTAIDIRHWSERFLADQPAIIMVGDLG